MTITCLRCGRDLTHVVEVLGDRVEVKREHDRSHLLEIQEAAAEVIQSARALLGGPRSPDRRMASLRTAIAHYDAQIANYKLGFKEEP